MRAVNIITKKRDGGELTRDEIKFFIQGYARGEIPDYQASAWAMAVFFKGMTARETTDLTLAIVDSGEKLDLSKVVEIAVDKHSTGGVGDKTTLVVEPLVSSCGLPVGKMSGRGLGFSGGTLDKMESIPGYRCDLSTDEFLSQLHDVGLVLTGQTTDLAPADGKLYSLRDCTGTVQSIPLIASSVMSKKIAAGAQAILLDVKIGLGAFMQTEANARILARRMVDIAKYFLPFTQEESCGKCVPCRIGTRQLFEILNRITQGRGEEGDIKKLKSLAKTVSSGSLCALGQTAPNPILTTLKYFLEEYEIHIKEKSCPALVCKDLIIYYIEPKKCVGCLLCLKSCPVDAISGERKKLHVIDHDLCIKCGACLEVCPPKVSAVSKYTGTKKEKLMKKTSPKRVKK